MHKHLCWLIIFISLAIPCQAQAPQKYSMAEIEVSPAALPKLLKLGLPVDYCARTYQKGRYIFKVVLTAPEIAALEKTKLPYTITIDDMAAYYLERNRKANDSEKARAVRKALGTRMEYGSMGGFYTLEEINATLDKLYADYGAANLITQKVSIGTSIEGRPIYAVKISDNANVDESATEPGALYTALTHCREPAGMMTVFYFMYYLLEQYNAGNQRVRNIVDNTQLFFIPCVNPDGYYYNQTNYPNGGGMQRKNRNPEGNVDLNRNFGPQNLWDYPNGGSSTSSWSQTYRGKAPNSEPEVAALCAYVAGKNIRTALNYHTYSNLLIYPWGIKDQAADPQFPVMAAAMTKINGYSYGTAEGLLYAVRGVADDFLWQEHGIFAMTPEVGGHSDGFWPSKSRIFPLAEENLEANLLLAEYASTVTCPVRKHSK